MTAELAEQTAQALLKHAEDLARLDLLVRNLCRSDCAQVRECRSAVDLLTGPEIAAICNACSELAMRIDRAALVKFPGTDADGTD